MTTKVLFTKLQRSKAYLPLVAILLLAGYFFFLKLGRNIFWDWDECLYAQYSREMFTQGHYLTNIWNGYIDMQKPPLYTWLLQAPRYLLGESEFSLRLLSALPALGLLASVYMFAKKYFSVATAVFASLILLTAEVFVIYSLRLSTDMLFSLFIFLGCWAWIESRLRKSAGRLTLISGVLLGLATMVKGLGAAQFIGALFVTVILYPKRQHFVDFIKVCLIVVAIALPWHIIAYLQYGNDFIRIYIMENIIQRGKYPLEFHRERWWFYFVLMYRELQPWLFAGLVFPIVGAISFVQSLKSKKVKAFLESNRIVITVLLLILIPLFSLVRFQTRIAWYILPLYPFIAVYFAYNISICAEKVTQLLLKIRPMKWERLLTVVVLIVMINISYDAFGLLMSEVKPHMHERTYSQRDLAIKEINSYSHDSFDYLVPVGERMAREILPPTEQIDMTWVYGGHPCAVYYSNKKVNYHYDVDEFKKKLGRKGKLYMLSNGDMNIVSEIEEQPQILYQNDEFAVITYK